jgi:hypothetical protein
LWLFRPAIPALPVEVINMQMRNAALSLALVLLPAGLAHAQAPAQSLAELQLKVRIGEKVQVIDRSGNKTEGRFDGVSGSSLALIARGSRREFLETQIREVTRQRPESKWDGTLIGLGAGALAGFISVKTHCRNASERDDCLAVGYTFLVPIFAGAGAGTGALIDLAIKRHDTIFAPAVASSYRLRVSPLLTGQRKGVAVSILF